MITFAELTRGKTVAELKTSLLSALAALDFPVTSWHDGGVAKTLLIVEAQVLAELHGLIATVARSQFIGEDGASGEWLTLLVKSVFGLDRIRSTFARHSIRLTCIAGAGPYSVTSGQLVVGRSNGTRYRSMNASTEVIPSGGTLDLTVQCETAGEVGNAAPTQIITPALAGVSMSVLGPVLTARNEESDVELRRRAVARWSTLSLPNGNANYRAYEFLLTSAVDEAGLSCGITRVALATLVAGTVTAWVAGANDNITSDQLADATTYVRARAPLTDTFDFRHATKVTVAVSGTVQFKSGENTTPNQQAVVAAIGAFFSTFPIASPTEAVELDREAIAAAIYAAVPGKIRDLDLSAPAADLALTTGQFIFPNTAGLGWA